MNRKIHLYIMTALCAANAQADLPLSLEGISSEEHRMKLGLSMTYYNRNADIYTQGSNYFLTPLQQLQLLMLPRSLMKIATKCLNNIRARFILALYKVLILCKK